jgi:hypothetical protein
MLKRDLIIHNSNGNDYKVIVDFGNYTLLTQVKPIPNELSEKYIVAWCLNEYKDGFCWEQGHYFHNIDNAKQSFKEKTGYTVEYIIENLY